MVGCMKGAASIREEFDWEKTLLRYPRQDVFYLPQWHMPFCIFMLYRILVSSYFFAWLIGSIIYLETQTDVELYPWPVYLTNLSYLLLTCHLLAAVILGLKQLPRWGFCHVPSFQEQSDDDLELTWIAGEEIGLLVPLIDKDAGKLPCLIKLDWLLFNIACTSGIIAVVAYWTILPQWEGEWLPLDIQQHIVTIVVTMLEMLLSAIPMYILHVIYPMIFAMAYVIFTVIFWVVGHENVVYPLDVLDWNEPIWAAVVACVFIFVVVPIVHVFLWGLCRVRWHVYKKCCLDPNNNTTRQSTLPFSMFSAQ